MIDIRPSVITNLRSYVETEIPMIEDNQMVLTVAQWRDILNLLPDDPDFDELADQIDEAIDGMPFAGEVGILLTDADLAYVGGLVETVVTKETT